MSGLEAYATMLAIGIGYLFITFVAFFFVVLLIAIFLSLFQ